MKELLWQPSQARIKNANMTRFIKLINQRHKKQFCNYDELYQWSIENISDFWECLWEFGEIIFSQKYEMIVDDLNKMPGAKWFIGAKLNFAENLLRYRDNHIALIFKSEGQKPVRITYAELYNEVARLAKSMRDLGITKGDRVVGFVPNKIETVIAMLATASIGAIWSSCSPDFGIMGALERFRQIEPKLLFTANGACYKGSEFDSLEKISGIIRELPEIIKVIVIPYIKGSADIFGIPNSIYYQDFISKQKRLEIKFEQVAFDHPLYIMYSSGTTGLPKCIVHSAGGTLIQHLKELKLHTDLKREDVIFYFTTCGWMMWNWLVSSLALGASVILYDGSPFYPDSEALWKLIQDEKVTIFGTSPPYLAKIEKEGIQPKRKYNLNNLRTILSTGSPLTIENSHYVYREIKKDVQLSSISGGTDIIGCFILGNPIGPVYSGELQCRALAMKVEAFDTEGKPVTNQRGELVCETPFPSMPIYFWNDSNGNKYHSAYFEKYPNVWTHGDYIEITDTGGAIIYGRSDATLNPGGVRIGTAEIYRQVETLPEIVDSIAVGQNWQDDIRIVLFVKLAKGIELTVDLKNKIKQVIKEHTSSRHVPTRIIAVKDIPYTISMKKVELAVRNIIHGMPVANKDALANPESLDYYVNLPELQS